MKVLWMNIQNDRKYYKESASLENKYKIYI